MINALIVIMINSPQLKEVLMMSVQVGTQFSRWFFSRLVSMGSRIQLLVAEFFTYCSTSSSDSILHSQNSKSVWASFSM